ncbi:Aerobactin synthase IucA [Serratia fonticola]|uniref:Aerobactin synthase IucA n=1 Tax=Serratia fonticola TaxID=47917 RepID=A0A4U9VH27_SERFO|nr:Aerobactin synthase IucA [Serratia fonticola]
MTIQLASAATDVAAQCFLNALMRETRDWHIVPATHSQQPQLHLPLSDSQFIRIPLRHISPTQHHQYQFPACLNGNGEALSFERLVTFVAGQTGDKRPTE